MVEVNAIKDGNGNIIITENSFEMLLACLDNQKFVDEAPQNGDSISIGKDEYYKVQDNIQKFIDDYNRECRNILHQKYVFDTEEDGYFLTKRYELQDNILPWSSDDVNKIFEALKVNNDWSIERSLRHDYDYLTISEDGIKNRYWTQDEIVKINKLFNRKDDEKDRV